MCEPVTCDTYCPLVSAAVTSAIPAPRSSKVHQLRSVSQLNAISSLFLSKQGFKYTKIPGECCGVCKAEGCVVIVGHNATRVLHVTIPGSAHFWSWHSYPSLSSPHLLAASFLMLGKCSLRQERAVSHSLTSNLSHETPVLTKTPGNNADTERWLSEINRKIQRGKQRAPNGLRLWKLSTHLAQGVILSVEAALRSKQPISS